MRERRTFIIVGLILIVASLALAAFMLQPSAQDLLINAAEAMEPTVPLLHRQRLPP